MKVLLVRPAYFRLLGSHNNRLPLSLCYLAEILSESAHVCKVYNVDSEQHEEYASWKSCWNNYEQYKKNLEREDYYDDYKKYVQDYEPAVVIIESGSIALPTVDVGTVATSLKCAEITRKVLPNCKLIAYGVFPTIMPEKFEKVFDTVICGEGEEFICDVVEKEKGVVQLDPISSYTFENIPFITPDFLVIPISSINLDYIMSSRGCPFKCAFCLSQLVCQRKVRFRTIDRFINELRFRKDTFGVKDFYIADMEFNLKRYRAIEICSSLEPLDINWWCEIRPQMFDIGLATAMVDSGCKYIKVGVEAGTQKMLNFLNKQTALSEIKDTFAVAKKAGLKVSAYIMLGYPGATRKEYLEMYKFITDLGADYYVVNITIPYPKTPLFDKTPGMEKFMDSFYDGSWMHLSKDIAKDVWEIDDDILDMFFELSFSGKENGELRKYK